MEKKLSAIENAKQRTTQTATTVALRNALPLSAMKTASDGTFIVRQARDIGESASYKMSKAFQLVRKNKLFKEGKGAHKSFNEWCEYSGFSKSIGNAYAKVADWISDNGEKCILGSNYSFSVILTLYERFKGDNEKAVTFLADSGLSRLDPRSLTVEQVKKTIKNAEKEITQADTQADTQAVTQADTQAVTQADTQAVTQADTQADSKYFKHVDYITGITTLMIPTEWVESLKHGEINADLMAWLNA